MIQIAEDVIFYKVTLTLKLVQHMYAQIMQLEVFTEAQTTLCSY